MLPTYRIIVAGGRDFNNYDMAQEEIIDFLVSNFPLHFDGKDSHIQFVLGGAKGADSLGERFADEYGFQKKMFIPNWNRQPDGSYDKKAGIIRNHEMGDYATHLIAFWNNKSRGTKDMIDYATKKGLVVKVVRYGG